MSGVIFGPCPTKRQCGCDGSGVGYDNQDGGYPYVCLCRDPTWVHENCPHCAGSGRIEVTAW